MALCASLLALVPADRSDAAGTTFAPLPNATEVDGGVYSGVVADGAGTFHSVMREDRGAQAIVYRRSTDGGRTWLEYGRWAGESGGATDPVIAASGKRVAVMFLGGYCQGALCGRAPYLVGSTDSGATFGTPVRMANNASAVAIGIAGERTWAAWQMRNAANSDVVVLKGYSAQFAPLRETAIPGYSPRIATGAGGGVLTFVREEIAGGQRRLVPTAQLIDGDTLGKREDLGSVPVDAAVADGRAHLLFREGRDLLVRSAPVDGTDGFGGRVLALVGEGGSIAARPGLVAVAAVDQATGVTRVARSTDGTSFSRPGEVATTKDRPYRVELAVATLPADEPTITVGWSVPPRYADRDADGFPDPANSGRAPTLAVATATLAVTLDACTSRPGEGATLNADSYRWTRDGKALAISGCTGTVEVADGQTAVIGLEVTDSSGGTAVRSIDVTPQDLLVVSLGDSVASGEGNPHVSIPSETWEDGPCHRTHFAGPALAAQQLEKADPHSSVTFVQLACSGAAIMDVPAVPGLTDPVDDPNTGGLLDGYHGVEPDGSGSRPAQLEQMRDLIGSRTPDAVTISIGANDVVFSEVLSACLLGTTSCLLDDTKAVLDARLAELPNRYSALGRALAELGVADDSVFLTEYYDVASNSLGLADLKCASSFPQVALLRALISEAPELEASYLLPIVDSLSAGALINDDEAAWSREYLGARINQEVRAGAAAQRWHVVGGFDKAFARHGYCSLDPWVVTIPQSYATQRDEYGSFHPNRAGHQEYGRRLGAALTSSLIAAEDPTPSSPAMPLGDLYVVTSGTGEATVAAIRDEGGDLVPLAQRTLDRVASGDGYVAGLAPAADGTAAVATWTQLAQGSVLTWRSLLAQVALRENIALTSASFSQAAEGASALVPGRPTTVLARFRIDTAGPTVVEADVTVTDDTTGQDVGTQAERFRLNPGHGIAALPITAPFLPEPGHTYSARISVKDPNTAGPTGAADNVLEISAAGFPALVPTRSLDLVAVPLLVEGGEVDCAAMMARLPAWAERASAMMPVANEVNLDGGCATVGTSLAGDPIPATDKGIAEALVTLDYLARITGRDGVVGVAPEGWLKQVRPIIGIAMMGARGLIVDVASSESTFAHEVTHNLGVDHLETPATGVWVQRRQIRDGVDYMATVDAPDWVSARTWDALVDAIGGPEFAPKPPAPDAKGVWVRGWVYPYVDGQGNTRWAPTPATWVRAEGGTSFERELALEELQLSFKLQQVDANGAALGDPQSVSLGAVDGRYLPGATPGEPNAYGYNTVVEPLPGAVELVLTVTDPDGTREVDRRTLGQAPTVGVAAPVAGIGVGRGSPLEVAWTAQDADTPPEDLVTDLLVSGDDGVTWEPLATDVGASPATVTVPADLDGDAVRVRVVVSDGVQAGTAESGAFSVGSTASEVRDRVAFTRDVLLETSVVGNRRLFLMDPDGAQEMELDLPTTQDWTGTPQSDANDNPIGYQCEARTLSGCVPVFQDPAWSPDGSRLYFSSDLIADGFGGAAVPGTLDRVSMHLWSVAADGSDLQRVTQPRTQPQTQKPAPYSVNNRCVDAGPGGITWLGTGVVYDGFTFVDGPRESIWLADPDGSNQRRVFGWDVASRTDQAGWPTFEGTGWDVASPTSVGFALTEPFWVEGRPGSCPRLSPDGSHVAFPARVTRVGATSEVSAQAVVVVGTDSKGLRVVTDRDGRNPNDDLFAIDWSSDSTLVVTRRAPRASGDCTIYSYGSSSYDLSASPPTKAVLTPTQNECVAPAHRRLNPDGLLYGEVASAPRLGNWDLGVLDPAAPNGVRIVGAPTTRDTQFAWGRRTVGSGGPNLPLVAQPDVVEIPPVDAGGPYSATAHVPLVLTAGGSVLAGDALASVAWDLDGDGQFDDAEGRNPTVVFPEAATVEIRIRVTPGTGVARTSEPSVVTVIAAPDPAFEVDPGVEDSAPPQPVVGPIPRTVSIPAGVLTEVRLGPDDAAGPFVVTGAAGDHLALVSGDGAPALPGLAASGSNGTIWVTADPAFRGTTRLTYAHADDLTRTETVEVTVTGNAAPAPADDVVEADAGVRMDLAPATLLGNDSDPDGPQGDLRVVSVTGMTSGQAWLSADGDLVVVIPGAASGTFMYAVTDGNGGLGTATVRVNVRGTGPSTPPSPTPSPTPSPPPVVTPPVVNPPVVTPPVVERTAVTISHRAYFRYKSTKLTKKQKRALRAFLAEIPDGAEVTTRSVGVVRIGGTKADKRRALKRARMVRAYLVARGLTGEIKVSNRARTASKRVTARRVNVLITYTVTR